jgi:hypothetical protein
MLFSCVHTIFSIQSYLSLKTDFHGDIIVIDLSIGLDALNPKAEPSNSLKLICLLILLCIPNHGLARRDYIEHRRIEIFVLAGEGR